jgi:hypothetical protein
MIPMVEPEPNIAIFKSDEVFDEESQIAGWRICGPARSAT